MEIIKQELSTLEVNNSKQVKLINDLMEELASIYTKMNYIDGTEQLIHNEQIWMRLTKTHFYPIISFLSIKEALRLRLVSRGFNKQIIATFDKYKNQYSTMLELKNVELQTYNVVIPPTQEELNLLLQAQTAVQQLTKNMIVEMKAFAHPPNLVKQVMGALLLLLTGNKPNNDSDVWQASQKLLNSMDFLNRLLTFDKDNLSEKLCQNVEHELEGITFERCQQISIASAELFRYVQGIILFSQLPSVKAKQNKIRLESNIKRIESSIKLFEKYS